MDELQVRELSVEASGARWVPISSLSAVALALTFGLVETPTSFPSSSSSSSLLARRSIDTGITGMDRLLELGEEELVMERRRERRRKRRGRGGAGGAGTSDQHLTPEPEMIEYITSRLRQERGEESSSAEVTSPPSSQPEEEERGGELEEEGEEEREEEEEEEGEERRERGRRKELNLPVIGSSWNVEGVELLRILNSVIVNGQRFEVGEEVVASVPLLRRGHRNACVCGRVVGLGWNSWGQIMAALEVLVPNPPSSSSSSSSSSSFFPSSLLGFVSDAAELPSLRPLRHDEVVGPSSHSREGGARGVRHVVLVLPCHFLESHLVAAAPGDVDLGLLAPYAHR